MKIIKLNESQFYRLFEDNGDSKFLDGNDSTKKFSSEVSNQTIVTDRDGEEEMSKPINTNQYADKQSVQQWGAINGRKALNSI